jgi:murein L,D-transpeptidase YafK
MKIANKMVLMEIIFSLLIINACSINKDKEGIKEKVDSLKAVEVLKPLSDKTFKGKQAKYERVKEAIVDKEEILRQEFKKKSISYPPEKIFLRAIKEERVLEVWIKTREFKVFIHLKDYNFTKISGKLGPKRKQGDNQVPEGFYYINRFNPQSKFYLSLGINYPNESDKILGDKEKPGNDIYIHGGSTSVGCIPIGDDNIKELYLLAVESENRKEKSISVHIFPSRLDDKNYEKLKSVYGDNSTLLSFWENLKDGFAYFENSKQTPQIDIDRYGRYKFR